MKAVLIPCCLIASIGVAAQQSNEPSFKSFYDIIKGKALPDKTVFPFPVTGNKQAVISASKLIKLPMDNMPCLVPDMNGFTMPVAGQNAIIAKTMPVLVPVLPVK